MRARVTAPRAAATVAIVAASLSLPLLVNSEFALSLLAQACIMAVLALSFNLLLGECGLLSFGHAVYSGIGAYAAIHALQALGQGRLDVPVMLLPLVGGLAGLLFGLLIGYPSTRRAGTTFAMVTFGITELAYAAALIFPRLSGGEAGISASRSGGRPLFGMDALTFSTDRQTVYLILAWTLIAIAAMAALRRTPLLRIANAVRDNPLRAESIGCDLQRVRWAIVALAGFFAGLSGALSAIHFEIVTPEDLGMTKSAAVLIATCIGGTTEFAGPIIGAIVYVAFAVALSNYTAAWQFYMGVLFVATMMVAPEGIAGFVSGRSGRLRNRTEWPWRVAAAGAMVAGGIALTELAYRLSASALPAGAAAITALLDPASAASWISAMGLLVVGVGASIALHIRRGGAGLEAE